MQCVGLTLAVRGLQSTSNAQPVTCRLHVAELAQALWEARTGAADITCSVDAAHCLGHALREPVRRLLPRLPQGRRTLRQALAQPRSHGLVWEDISRPC